MVKFLVWGLSFDKGIDRSAVKAGFSLLLRDCEFLDCAQTFLLGWCIGKACC